jgi:Zn-dependent protease
MSQEVRTFALLLPVLLASMTLHELAHGWVAWKLGDPTAKLLGRISLNPIRHIDPLGTAMFAITYFGSSFIFGWAKPIPVMPRNFRNPQRGMAIVAIAGPLTNFAIALCFAALFYHADFPNETLDELVYYSYLVNIVLGVFNLFPIPPLDGSRIVGAVMDDDTYRRWSALDQYGMIFLLLIFFVFNRQFTIILREATNAVDTVFRTLVGG